MVAVLLGRKIGMTQVYDPQGAVHPVTVVQAGPCSVLQVKTVSIDGYDAVQLGFEDQKPHRARKPQIAHAAKAGERAKKFVKELRLTQAAQDIAPGQKLTVEQFEGVAYVDVTGTSKGKGFAGGMKRHHFSGLCASHGTERKHRSPGSIGSHATNRGTGPKLKKGKKMAGHMGMVRSTTRNHKLIRVDMDNGLLLIKGPLPGPNGGVVFVRASKTARVPKAENQA